MKPVKPTLVMIIAIIVTVIGFFGGMKYQQSKRPSFTNFAGRNGQFGQRSQGGQGFRPINGEILSADEKSITVKLQDGSSKIVLLTETTAYNKSSEGTKADLKAGERVGVFGTENSDGSVTAQNVQLNPMFRGIQVSPSGSPR